MRLPLPVASPAGATVFSVSGRPATVLTGLLWPSSGPLTAWAPVFSTYEADGSLRESETGGWIGPHPSRWLKVTKAGFVVGGFRVLVRTSPGTPQSRQVQVFWKPWQAGEAKGTVVESQAYGTAAGPKDEVKIIELRLPEGAVPTGLYGETLAGVVVQASLIVRLLPPPPATDPAATPSPSRMRTPSLPQSPVVAPVAPLPPTPF